MTNRLMLTKEDLRQIGEVVDQRLDVKLDEKLGKQTETIIEMVGTMLEDNIIPLFEGLDMKFEGLDMKFEGLDRKVTRIEATMVTKSYLDDKLAHYVRKPF